MSKEDLALNIGWYAIKPNQTKPNQTKFSNHDKAKEATYLRKQLKFWSCAKSSNA